MSLNLYLEQLPDFKLCDICKSPTALEDFEAEHLINELVIRLQAPKTNLNKVKGAIREIIDEY